MKNSLNPAFFILGLLLMPFFVSANIIVNEVAWMGTFVSTADEWMELRNNGSSNVDLAGWVLEWKGGEYKINFSEKCAATVIPAGGYFLLERTDDTTIPDINADCIYTGALSNEAETIILKDSSQNAVDAVDASGGWPAGDNTTKQTMQWTESGWTTATSTPGATNTGGSASQEPPPPEQQPQTQSSGGGSSTYVPPENLPKIKAYAGEDKTAFVGAAIEFRGKAYGLNNASLDNARYLWTFGDGGSKEGQNITHIYRYPGDYAAVLNVSSGEYSASDYITVKAIPNQVFISEVKTGIDSFIEIQNKSDAEIDISGIQLKSNGQIFTFPQSSRIKAGAYLVIPAEISNIVLTANQGVVEMFYPGGFKADSLGYSGVLKEGQSFSRNETGSAITSETPGAKNAAPIVTTVSSTFAVKETAVSKPEVKLAEATEPAPESASEPALASTAEPEIQTANVVATQPAPKSNTTIYLLAVLALAFFSSAGVFLLHRHRGA